MPHSRVEHLDDIGTVRIQKKRGVKRIRMRIHSSGEIRVSQPMYLPFSAGLHFAKLQKAWITKQKLKLQPINLDNGMAIGATRQLKLINSPAVRTRVTNSEVCIYYPIDDPTEPSQETLDLAKKAIKRALNAEAKQMLPTRVAQLAQQHGYTYSSIHIKPLKSRWGAC